MSFEGLRATENLEFSNQEFQCIQGLMKLPVRCLVKAEDGRQWMVSPQGDWDDPNLGFSIYISKYDGVAGEGIGQSDFSIVCMRDSVGKMAASVSGTLNFSWFRAFLRDVRLPDGEACSEPSASREVFSRIVGVRRSLGR